MARIFAISVLLLLGGFSISFGAEETVEARSLKLTYSVNVFGIDPETDSAVAWVPLPLSDEYQQLLGYTVDGDFACELVSEPEYGNQFLRFDLGPASSAAQFSLTFDVRRWPQRTGGGTTALVLADDDRARFTRANALVPVSGPHAEEAQRVAGGTTDALARGRLLYDHIIATVDYDKSGEGWGRGDVRYACDIRAGNCTDFHSLFIGEARSLGLPARFTIGFPVPMEEDAGEIGGYHCWAEFWADGQGWVPLDASEARKHPELRDKLFGQLPADRVAFTRGRDYKLPGSKARPVNFMIYPHVEVDGETLTSVECSFSYQEMANEKPRG